MAFKDPEWSQLQITVLSDYAEIINNCILKYLDKIHCWAFHQVCLSLNGSHVKNRAKTNIAQKRHENRFNKMAVWQLQSKAKLIRLKILNTGTQCIDPEWYCWHSPAFHGLLYIWVTYSNFEFVKYPKISVIFYRSFHK